MNPMNRIWQDVRYAFRTLRKSPGFTAVAVLTLALGIGANAAMFTIVNGVLLRPLPYPEPERLSMIWTKWDNFGQGSISQPEYFDLVERSESWAAIGLIRNTSVNLVDGDGEPERVRGARLTPSVFEALAVQPLLGRTFHPDEWIEGNHHVVVLGHDLWQRRFGGDPEILGRRITIGPDRFEIVGVMPEGFGFPNRDTQIWPAYGIDRDDLTERGSHSNAIVARLKDGTGHEQAQSELDRISAFLNDEYPGNYPPGNGFGFFARSLRDERTGDVRPALLTLLGAVGFVLLIACANVANLLLARIHGREKEIAIRSSLGAGRGRIVQQILTESLVLASLGGVGALVVAQFASRALLLLEPGNLPRLEQVRLDPSVLLFTGGLVVMTAIAFGLAPAFRAEAGNLGQKLKEGGRSGSAGLRSRARTALVVAEVALATVLLIGAGLMIRSVARMLDVDPGFRSDNILMTSIALDPGRYADREQRADFFRRLVDEVEAQSGVSSAAAINILPLSGWNSDQSLAAEGYSETAGDNVDFIQYRIVSPNYFQTLRIPIARGRSFEDADRIGAPGVAILSASLARKYWGDEDPIGRRVKPGGIGSDNPWLTVVGIAADVHHDGLDAGEVPIWYRPNYQATWSSSTIVARTTVDPTSSANLIRDAVRRLDPLQPAYGIGVLDEVVADSYAEDRFNAILFGVFAALALSLAGIGVYGLIGYSVSQRTQEIGVRVALGAQRRDILAMVLGQGMSLALIGVVTGLLGALALTRFLDAMLFGVGSRDVVTYGLVAGFILVTAMWACVMPARRATRVDPMVALHYE